MDDEGIDAGSDRPPRASAKEAFAAFFEDPSRDRLREVLQNHTGEDAHLDFKRAWPVASKLAKQILGLANTGDGCIIVGVEEDRSTKSLVAIGLKSLEDKATLFGGICAYIPDAVRKQIKILDFSYDQSEYAAIKGKQFQVLLVKFNSNIIPCVSEKDGDGLRSAAVYIRHEADTKEATYTELQQLIRDREESNTASSRNGTLKEQLEQLEILFTAIKKTVDPFQQIFDQTMANAVFWTRNPNYPQEDFEQFVNRLIEEKKRLISKAVGVER